MEPTVLLYIPLNQLTFEEMYALTVKHVIIWDNNQPTFEEMYARTVKYVIINVGLLWSMNMNGIDQI